MKYILSQTKRARVINLENTVSRLQDMGVRLNRFYALLSEISGDVIQLTNEIRIKVFTEIFTDNEKSKKFIEIMDELLKNLKFEVVK